MVLQVGMVVNNVSSYYTAIVAWLSAHSRLALSMTTAIRQSKKR